LAGIRFPDEEPVFLADGRVTLTTEVVAMAKSGW
jgi:hypothetical protein